MANETLRTSRGHGGSAGDPREDAGQAVGLAVLAGVLDQRRDGAIEIRVVGSLACPGPGSDYPDPKNAKRVD
jgi:hypothetical protein